MLAWHPTLRRFSMDPSAMNLVHHYIIWPPCPLYCMVTLQILSHIVGYFNWIWNLISGSRPVYCFKPKLQGPFLQAEKSPIGNTLHYFVSKQFHSQPRRECLDIWSLAATQRAWHLLGEISNSVGWQKWLKIITTFPRLDDNCLYCWWIYSVSASELILFSVYSSQ